MTTIDNLKTKREVLLNNLNELKNKKYHLSKEPFQKSVFKKALNAIDGVNIDIEKIEYKQSEVIKVLREAGLSASKKYTTAIRGLNTYTKGYEVDNKYSVSYISLHYVTQNECDLIHKLAEKKLLNISVDRQGVTLNK